MVYYRERDDKGKWLHGYVSNLEAIKIAAAHVTVLALDKIKGKDDDFDDVGYSGPLAFDIDSKDLNTAIAEFHSLLGALQFYGVDLAYCEIYASGHKGFHVLIPEALFRKPKPEKDLPLIYRRMATEIMTQWGLTALDMSLYSGGMGHMLRVANKARPDGRYKVPLTPSEALAITPISYQDFTQGPRIISPARVPKGALAQKLSELFSASYEQVKRQKKFKKTYRITPVDMLSPFGDGNYPECVNMLVQGDVKAKAAGGPSFNMAAMQLAAFVNSVPLSSSSISGLVTGISTALNSSQVYTSFSDRQRHVQAQIEFNKHSSYPFSCGAICSILAASPCARCPVKAQLLQAAKADEAIFEDANQYWRKGKERDINLSSFVLDPVRAFVQVGGTEHDIEAYDFIIHDEAGNKYPLHASADIFNSTGNFKGAIANKSSAKFRGTDVDLQDIKTLVYEKARGKCLATQTKVAGIQWITNMNTGGREYVYVEPQWACGAAGSVEHIFYADKEFTSQLPQYRCAKNTMFLLHDDVGAIEFVQRLLRISKPETLGIFIGWLSACLIKPFIKQIHGGFPLLQVYGEKGSGKTSLASWLSALTGSDYTAISPRDASIATQFSFVKELNMFTTAARVWDEATPAKMKSRTQAALVVECLKNAYNGGAMPRGALGARGSRSGPVVELYEANAPIIFLATSVTDAAELLDRTVDIEINSRDFKDTSYETCFEVLKQDYETLFRLNRNLLDQALRLTLDQLKGWEAEANSQVPKGYTTRAHKSLTAVLMGLRLFQEMLVRFGFPDNLVYDLQLIKQAVVMKWTDTGLTSRFKKAVTEGAKVLEGLATMAGEGARGQKRLHSMVHYIRKDDVLYLQPATCMAQFVPWARWTERRIEFTTGDQFIDHVKHEDYFISIGPLPGADEGRWMKLDISKLRDRGIDVSLFERAV